MPRAAGPTRARRAPMCPRRASARSASERVTARFQPSGRFEKPFLFVAALFPAERPLGPRNKSRREQCSPSCGKRSAGNGARSLSDEVSAKRAASCRDRKVPACQLIGGKRESYATCNNKPNLKMILRQTLKNKKLTLLKTSKVLKSRK